MLRLEVLLNHMRSFLEKDDFHYPGISGVNHQGLGNARRMGPDEVGIRLGATLVQENWNSRMPVIH
jgi:hypothetical protein